MSDRAVLKPGTRLERGTWRWALVDFVWLVKLTCPDCGLEAELDHEVAADGAVTPSVQCPRAGCSWHASVQLEGWTT